MASSSKLDRHGYTELDLEELGEYIARVFQAHSVLEDSSKGFLSPFVPTQDEVLRQIVNLITSIINALRARGRRSIVYYEPGCGDGRVAYGVSLEGVYIACIELDHKLLERAKSRYRLLHGDYVRADITSFTLRRVDVIYAYLLPQAIRVAVENINQINRDGKTILISLDYPLKTNDVREVAEVKIASHRSVYIYII